MSYNYPFRRRSFGKLTTQDKEEAREARLKEEKKKVIYEVEDMPIREAFKFAERKAME